MRSRRVLALLGLYVAGGPGLVEIRCGTDLESVFLGMSGHGA